MTHLDLINSSGLISQFEKQDTDAYNNHIFVFSVSSLAEWV